MVLEFVPFIWYPQLLLSEKCSYLHLFVVLGAEILQL